MNLWKGVNITYLEIIVEKISFITIVAITHSAPTATTTNSEMIVSITHSTPNAITTFLER